MDEYDFTIGEMGALLDIPSPAESLDMYGDIESSASESQSPIETPFDITMAPDFNNLACVLPSPATSPSINPMLDGEIAQEEKKPAKKPAPKRKRENRYKNAPPAVLSRRREQNRASQRAYRERKDQRIKDLEAMLEDQKQKNEQISQAFDTLQQEFSRLSKSRITQSHRSHSHPHLSLPFDMMMELNGPVPDGLDLYGFQPSLTGFPM